MSKTKSTLLILTRKDFEKLLEQHPQIGIKILKGLAKLLSMNLRKTSSLLADHMLPIG
jgi:CRP-like cAMP-binding protein